MQTVTEAQASLATAQAAEEQTRRADAVKQIERCRRRGAELRPQYEALAREVIEGQRERLRLHYVIHECRAQIQRWSAPLDPLEFPTDKDIRECARQRALWERKLAVSVEQYHAAARREGGRQRALEMNGELANLGYVIRNLERLAEGRQPGDAKGGLSYADAEFLRLPGFTPGNEVYVPAATDGKRVLAG